MRNLIISEFITLDGIIQAPGGIDEDVDGGFAHGGWTLPYWHDAIGEHFGALQAAADTFLLGRRTWEIHGAAFEPMADGADPFFDSFNQSPKYVVLTTLTTAAAWRNSHLIRENVVEEVRRLKALQVRRLKALPGKNILLDGSSVLAQTLIANDLVDELVLHVYPLVLGSGKRLFPPGKRVNLELVESQALPTGVVYQRLRPIR